MTQSRQCAALDAKCSELTIKCAEPTSQCSERQRLSAEQMTAHTEGDPSLIALPFSMLDAVVISVSVEREHSNLDGPDHRCYGLQLRRVDKLRRIQRGLEGI